MVGHAVRARGVRRVVLALRLMSDEVMGALCAVSLGRVVELTCAHGWAVDHGGRVAPKADLADPGAMDQFLTSQVQQGFQRVGELRLPVLTFHPQMYFNCWSHGNVPNIVRWKTWSMQWRRS